MSHEPGSREELVFDFVFALTHRVPPDVLHALGKRRPWVPGQPENVEERFAAEAILEHLARAWSHGTLAHATGDFASEQPKMEADAHRALALNPSSANISVQLAMWSGNFGEPERGARLIEQAVRLNPSFPPFYRTAMREAYFFSGRFEDAVRAMLGRENGPTGVGDGMLLAAAYGHLGKVEEAQRAAETLLLKEVPNFSAELGFNFGYIFVRERERDLFVEGLRKAGLRVCAKDAELAPYPNAVRLPECVTS